MYLNILSQFDQTTFSVPHKEGEFLDYDGKLIIYKDEEGEEAGRITATNWKKTTYDTNKKCEILRKATQADIQKMKQLKVKASNAKQIFLNKVEEFKLEMSFSSVHYSFNDTKIEFTFTAPERVDFRQLVRELAKTLRRKIHLKQIGPRDRAQVTGGSGICGRGLCCAGFLKDIKSVSMDASREQNLIHKSTKKLSGVCGKLRCCLNYEIDLYQHLKKEFPKIGDKVTYQRKKMTILEIDYVNDRMRIVDSDKNYVFVDAGDLKEVKDIRKKLKK